MKDVLDILGNVPATTATIASLYPDVAAGNQKVAALEKSGKLIRLKRGLYIVNPAWSGKPASIYLIANHIYSPSYISRHTALRWYGLIPEHVFLTQSMTIKHTRSFHNALGSFDYTNVDRDYFSIGLRQVESEGARFIIASPEKALCDLVYTTAGVNLRYIKEAELFLEEDMRIDLGDLRDFDLDILRQCARAGKKTQSIETIIKLLER
jgi:predicted transcriptional regulator of viral defense system